jgi:hypothetical protein
MSVFELDVSTLGSIHQITETIAATESHLITAAYRALNKTALWLKTQSVREISSQKRIQQKLIRERLRIVKANRNSLKSLVIASLYGIKASKLGRMHQTSKGAKAGNYEFSGAFIAKMPMGHIGIYKRKTKRRLPIKELTVPLEPVASNIIKAFVDTDAAKKFNEYFRHELKFILRKTI